MEKIDIRITPIEPDCFYHIYNRGINGEIIFKAERNYQFLLLKIKSLFKFIIYFYH
ncbi:hypothetical protein SAMN05421847_0675 [Halpernia humi]|uniref:Uncharacterized protein n=1 Tax=Halpernia humi TaxID=493375 RepID=A0A1H5U7P3_9FLAO|nr:hypothetical protein SAMN05421847_0675 [Halpernia humi]